MIRLMGSRPHKTTKSAERSEKRDEHDQDERVEGRNGAVPGRRDVTEKGRPLGGKREESREHTEEKIEKR